MVQTKPRPMSLEHGACACAPCTGATVVLVQSLYSSCVFLVKALRRSCACVLKNWVPWCERARRANRVQDVRAVRWCVRGNSVTYKLRKPKDTTVAVQGDNVNSASAVQSKSAVNLGVRAHGLSAGPVPPDSAGSLGTNALDYNSYVLSPDGLVGARLSCTAEVCCDLKNPSVARIEVGGGACPAGRPVALMGCGQIIGGAWLPGGAGFGASPGWRANKA